MQASLSLQRVLFCCVTLGNSLVADANMALDDRDLVQGYNVSSHVFYGELDKVIPEPNFRTGVQGVHPHRIEGSELHLAEIVWPQARELSFVVKDPFKASMSDQFVAYLPDPSQGLWAHLVSADGDVFLAQPEVPDALLRNLKAGDRALFFIRHFPGSTIPLVHRVRFGQLAEDEIKLLRAYRASSGQSLQSIVQEARAREAAASRQEAAEFKVFEDEYYKILRMQDIEIRRSLLYDLIERMGFRGLWDYFEYRQRYLDQHGAHVQSDEIPAGPTVGKEKLWHDISGELRKIEVMLEASQR
ncbi:MAG: hypothetical protein EA353_01120 [Puniceicoccaceae bacterium]|nr:MAG: hypothetical protein EA353_01120 [Puniceicoccaceae bacterium]